MASIQGNTDENQKHQKQDVDCRNYQAIAGQKRCRNYLNGGFCSLSKDKHCIQWLKVNKAHSSPSTQHANLKKKPKERFSLEVTEAPKVTSFSNRRDISEQVHEQTKRVQDSRRDVSGNSKDASSSTRVDEVPPTAAMPITKEDIDSFKRLEAEVCIETETGPIWIVPRYTGADRKEFTPEHIAFLMMARWTFPDATITRVEKIQEVTPVERLEK